MLATNLGRFRYCLLTTVIAGFILICVAALLRAQFAWTLSYLPYFSRISGDSAYDYTKFGDALFAALEANPPGISPIPKVPYADGLVFWKATNTTSRPDDVHLDSTQVTTMRGAHTNYLQTIHALKSPYRPGTTGIVSTAGGIYLSVFIISLRMLRRTGCSLPVELFLLSPEEHGPYLCDTLLPSLNARCVTLSDSLGTERATNSIAKFQIKVFSILFSTFENILFLDADNFLVSDPTNLFTSDPFALTSLVTWPDFWASSASAHFYSIIDRPIPPMNAHASSESGQLMVSKATHDQALMAAAYYNFYGPEYFYTLLTQGGPGGGDKETFVAGALAVGVGCHQLRRHVDTIGYYEGERDGQKRRYHGVAMVQYDPAEDATSMSGSTKHKSEEESPRPFSVHHNYPKTDPVELFSDEGAAVDRVTGVPHRLLGEMNDTVQRFGRDIEEELWEEIEYVACELGDKFRYWKTVPSTSERNGTCEQVRQYRMSVFGVM